MATVTISEATKAGDTVTVRGTVDGRERTVTVWQSHLSTLATKAARVAYVAGRLKEVDDAQQGAAVDVLATVTVP